MPPRTEVCVPPATAIAPCDEYESREKVKVDDAVLRGVPSSSLANLISRRYRMPSSSMLTASLPRPEKLLVLNWMVLPGASNTLALTVQSMFSGHSKVVAFAVPTVISLLPKSRSPNRFMAPIVTLPGV